MPTGTETSSASREDGDFGRHDVCKGQSFEDKIEGNNFLKALPHSTHVADKAVHVMPGGGHHLIQASQHLRHCEDKGGPLMPLKELRKFSKRIVMLSTFARRVQDESAKRTRTNEQVTESQTL